MTKRKTSVGQPDVHRPSAQGRIMKRQEFEIVPCLLGTTEPRQHARAERTPVERIRGARENLEDGRQTRFELVELALEERPCEGVHREGSGGVRIVHT